MQWRHLECGCGFKGYEWQKTWWLNTVVPGERIDEEAYRIGTGEHGFVRAIGDLRTRTMELTVSAQNWRQKWILGKWKPMRIMEKQLTKLVQWQHNRCTLYCRRTQFEPLSDNRLFWWTDFSRFEVQTAQSVGWVYSVGTATPYVLDGPGVESRWVRDFPHLSRSALGATQLPESPAAMFKVKLLPSSWRYDTVWSGEWVVTIYNITWKIFLR